MPHYQRIAEEMRTLIERRTLAIGQKLPSLRTAAQQFGVSLPTVLQAYVQLEAEGYVTAQERSGFFVEARRQVPASDVLVEDDECPAEFSGIIRWMFDPCRLSGFCPLGVNGPSLALYPIDKLNVIARDLVRRHGLDLADYANLAGHDPLRELIACRLIDAHKVCSPDDVLVTSGGSEALNLCLRAVTRPGDQVIVEAPGYFGSILAVESLHLRVLPVKSHAAFGIDLDDVEVALRRCDSRVRAIILTANFSNPLGSLMPLAAKRRLIALGAEFEVPIIEDDANGELYFDGKRPPTLKSLDENDNVLLCGTFSKTLSPGLRVGYIVSRRHSERLRDLKFSSSNATATLPQFTIASFIGQGPYERHLRRLRGAFRLQVDTLATAVETYFPAGCEVTRPRGGCFLWVRLPANVDALEVQKAAYRDKISIAPGPLFSSLGAFRQYIRLNAGVVWSEYIRSGVERLGMIVAELQAKDLARSSRTTAGDPR